MGDEGKVGCLGFFGFCFFCLFVWGSNYTISKLEGALGGLSPAVSLTSHCEWLNVEKQKVCVCDSLVDVLSVRVLKHSLK